MAASDRNDAFVDAVTEEVAQAERSESLRFARRLRRLRMLGLGVGSLSAAAVFLENGAHPATWAALVFYSFVWPQLAYLLAVRSADPQRAERRNLLFDSTAGGVWVALMQFNLLPSALVVTMTSIDKMVTGGWQLLLRTASAQAVAIVLAAALNGFAFQPVTSMFVLIACLPLLFVYPMAISTVGYALARKVRRQNRRLTELNRIDGLTGVLNRHHWEEALDGELRRHLRSGRPAALLLIDVDDFKPINDLLGHTVGDEVIRGVAGVIRDSIRDIDVAGRYGGDEFGVLLPETGIRDAIAAAERIRQRVEDCAIGVEQQTRCTVSIGAMEATPSMQDARDWIAEADAMLYFAKAEGRNRVGGLP